MSKACCIIKEFLEEVKAGKIAERDVGLCWNFQCFCKKHDLLFSEINVTREVFKNMLRNFPKYTGDDTYPLVPSDEYDEHLYTEADFYDPATPYGAIRLEFVDWALKELAQNEASYMKS
jgi:hypothetical protein